MIGSFKKVKEITKIDVYCYGESCYLAVAVIILDKDTPFVQAEEMSKII